MHAVMLLNYFALHDHVSDRLCMPLTCMRLTCMHHDLVLQGFSSLSHQDEKP